LFKYVKLMEMAIVMVIDMLRKNAHILQWISCNINFPIG
jgi:hypothetical protein